MDPPLGGPNSPTPYRETPMTNPYDAPKTETPFKGPSPSQGTNTLAIVSLVLLTALGILGVAMNQGGMQFQQQFNQ